MADKRCFVGMDPDGKMVFANLEAMNPKDILCIGRLGGGKARHLYDRLLSDLAENAGAKVVIIDPEGEFKERMEIGSGSFIHLGGDQA